MCDEAPLPESRGFGGRVVCKTILAYDTVHVKLASKDPLRQGQPEGPAT